MWTKNVNNTLDYLEFNLNQFNTSEYTTKEMKPTSVVLYTMYSLFIPYTQNTVHTQPTFQQGKGSFEALKCIFYIIFLMVLFLSLCIYTLIYKFLFEDHPYCTLYKITFFVCDDVFYEILIECMYFRSEVMFFLHLRLFFLYLFDIL